MNLLFTHSNFDGPLGASTIGAESNRGACANSPLQVGETAESTNAALVTSNHYGMSVSLSTLVHTAVHELGHSWGAQHTCCVTGSDCAAGFACDDEQVFSQCNPSTGDKFVMHPILGEDMISLLFSTCSRDAMSALLARRSECVRASECAFGGSCCEGRRHVRRRGTMCRAPPVFNSCELAHTCDGVSALCPSDPQYAPDGTACLLPSFGDKQSIRFGVCLNATCSPQHHDHCTRKGLHGCTGATHAGGHVATRQGRAWMKRGVHQQGIRAPQAKLSEVCALPRGCATWVLAPTSLKTWRIAFPKAVRGKRPRGHAAARIAVEGRRVWALNADARRAVLMSLGGCAVIPSRPRQQSHATIIHAEPVLSWRSNQPRLSCLAPTRPCQTTVRVWVLYT